MINDFKATIARRGGLSKANRFDVIINLPTALNEADRGRDLTLLCEAAAIPGKQITSLEYSMYNHQRKIPTGYILEDLTLIFNITNDYYVKSIFDEWQDLIISQESFLLAYDSEFQVDLQIRQLGEDDKPVWNTTVIGAYPITVNGISLDNNSDSTTQKLAVTFAYTEIKK